MYPKETFLSNVEIKYVHVGQNKNFFLIKTSRQLFNCTITAEKAFTFSIIIGVGLNFSEKTWIQVSCILAMKQDSLVMGEVHQDDISTWHCAISR